MLIPFVHSVEIRLKKRLIDREEVLNELVIIDNKNNDIDEFLPIVADQGGQDKEILRDEWQFYYNLNSELNCDRLKPLRLILNNPVNGDYLKIVINLSYKQYFFIFDDV